MFNWYPDGLTYQDCLALDLILVEGKSQKEASVKTGLTIHRIKRLLGRDDVKEIQGRLVSEMHDELKLLGKIVVKRLRECLDDSNRMIQLQAIDKFFRTQGMYKEVVEGRLSAEDVARELLKGREKQRVDMDSAPVGAEEFSDLFDADETTIH